MAHFIGQLAMFAGAALGVWGLLLLQRGLTIEPSRLIRSAGYLAIVIGFGGALCIAAFQVCYWIQGDYGHAYPAMHMMPMENATSR